MTPMAIKLNLRKRSMALDLGASLAPASSRIGHRRPQLGTPIEG
jgi:hypothetical protein